MKARYVFSLITATMLLILAESALAEIQLGPHAQLAGHITVPGNATDLFPGVGANQNRLGGFGSALHYDRVNDVYYGLVDRGPGGGVVAYQTRLQRFDIDVDPVTGAISNFDLQETIPFMNADGSAGFNGLGPTRLNGSPLVLGMSFDPEGLAVEANGHFYIADEYGPSLYEFAPVAVVGGTEARFVRAFTIEP